MELAKINTFIINFVENNENQIEKLRETFEDIKVKSRVQIFNNPTFAELEEIVKRLRMLNFDLFKYVVVIILDNKCDHGHFIRTRDNQNVLIDSEILTLFKTNKSLVNKPRFFVVQKLEDYRDSEGDPDDGNANKTIKVSTRSIVVNSSPAYKELSEVALGLEFSIRANENTDNFRESPFIDILCEEFLANSTEIPMDEIYCRILQKIKKNYRIDVQFSSNQDRTDSGILGKALDPLEERDFF